MNSYDVAAYIWPAYTGNEPRTRLDTEFTVSYFPHVSVGWDNNPRFETIRPGIVKNNTPNEIAKALRAARDYVDAHPGQPPLITVNSGNE